MLTKIKSIIRNSYQKVANLLFIELSAILWEIRYWILGHHILQCYDVLDNLFKFTVGCTLVYGPQLEAMDPQMALLIPVTKVGRSSQELTWKAAAEDWANSPSLL